jgi:hypothetical protein
MFRVSLLSLLTACTAPQKNTTTATPTDPTARAFTGTIISLRPLTSTMLISKDDHLGNDRFPNEILVKYDANTQFQLDTRPTTLDRIRQYMTVHIAGHMHNEQLLAETANFSSTLPTNVRPSP